MTEMELQMQVESCLRRARLASLRSLRVSVTQDTVIVTGIVNTYYEKQSAQEIVKLVPGVAKVVNRVEVHGLAGRNDGESGAELGEPT